MTLIRYIAERDEAQWRNLWAQYLEFYEAELPEALTDQLFKRLLTGEPHFAFVAEQDAKIVGFVHCLPHASTWADQGYLYLEDLFADPSVRGTGIGRKLIEKVYSEADRRALSRVYWHTDKGNATARRLYDRLAELSDFVQYRRYS